MLPILLAGVAMLQLSFTPKGFSCNVTGLINRFAHFQRQTEPGGNEDGMQIVFPGGSVNSNSKSSDTTGSTFNWTGAANSDWSNSANWSNNAVPGSADSVRIGYVSFTHQPVISANTQVAYLQFGGSAPDTLTVNSADTLWVSGSIVQGHNADNAVPSTLLQGNGSIRCDSLIVGNNVLPKVVGGKSSLMISRVAFLNISGNLVIRSCTIDLLSGGIGHNNSLFSLEGGQLTVSGQIVLDNLLPAYLDSLANSKPLAKFRININSSQNATLVLTDSSSVVGTHAGCDSIDFYNYVFGTGKSIVEYAGVNQLLYTNNMAGIDTLPYTYQNLAVTAAGTKVAGAVMSRNHLNIGGDLSVTGGTLDLQTNAAACMVYGNYTNRSVTNVGSPGMVFKGPSFFNSNQFNHDNAWVTFSGGTQNLTDSTSSGTNLRFVAFADTGIKHIHRGTFAIIPSGKVSLSNSVNVTVDTTSTFILRSDSTGTAALTAIPSGSVINGIVNAEWFAQGSWTNLNARGYRIISSPVNHTGNTDGKGDYHVNWLKGTTPYNGSIITGPFSGLDSAGFDLNGNPTLYIYREDVNYSNGSFTSGNYRGMNKINNTDPNNIGTQKRFTITPVADTTIRLPIGNGVLFFFRGNRVSPNGTTSGTKTVSPFNYPESVTFTNKGTINQGKVQVKLYFRNDNYLSYTDSSYISNAQSRGLNQVGNPYPSAINWDNFSQTDSTASIYGPGLSDTIQVYDPIAKVFNIYIADSTHNRDSIYNGSGSATNIIASGEGFFVHVNPTLPNRLTASLRFREAAKFNPPSTMGAMMLSARQADGLQSKNITGVTGKSKALRKAASLRYVRISLRKAGQIQSAVTFDLTSAAGASVPPIVPPDPDSALTLTAMIYGQVSNKKAAVIPLRLPARSAQVPVYTDAEQNGTYELGMDEVSNLSPGYSAKLKDL
ncbi:MAG: hypothetical protein ACTHJ8_18710, partial [Mucilaginibacter sp.]